MNTINNTEAAKIVFDIIEKFFGLFQRKLPLSPEVEERHAKERFEALVRTGTYSMSRIVDGRTESATLTISVVLKLDSTATITKFLVETERSGEFEGVEVRGRQRDRLYEIMFMRMCLTNKKIIIYKSAFI